MENFCCCLSRRQIQFYGPWQTFSVTQQSPKSISGANMKVAKIHWISFKRWNQFGCFQTIQIRVWQGIKIPEESRTRKESSFLWSFLLSTTILVLKSFSLNEYFCSGQLDFEYFQRVLSVLILRNFYVLTSLFPFSPFLAYKKIRKRFVIYSKIAKNSQNRHLAELCQTYEMKVISQNSYRKSPKSPFGGILRNFWNESC